MIGHVGGGEDVRMDRWLDEEMIKNFFFFWSVEKITSWNKWLAKKNGRYFAILIYAH